MNSLFNAEEDLPENERPVRRDREISLGATTILGIFFALSLIGAVIFGAGYTLGRRSAQSTVAAATGDATSGSPFANFKPAPGSVATASFPAGTKPVNTVAPAPAAVAPTSTASGAVVVGAPSSNTAANPYAPIDVPKQKPAPVQIVHPVNPDASIVTAVTPPVRQTPPPAPVQIAQAAPASTATSGAPVSALVQVAAVSHQEDADVLVNALKKRGYSVMIRQEPQDHLLHVQIGPFASRKDADAMRQRLLSDGYNAIVK